MEEYAKAAAEIIKAGLRQKEAKGEELKFNHDTIGSVNLYTDSQYDSVDDVAHTDYMHIGVCDISVTFSSGRVHKIDFSGKSDSIFLDINLFLREAKLALNEGVVTLEPDNLMLKAPGGTNIVEEKVVEVENSEHKTKADILDQLLGRNLSIN